MTTTRSIKFRKHYERRFRFKRYDFNENHPEEQEGEVFISNLTTEESEKILYKSKRFGKVAYSQYGEIYNEDEEGNKVRPLFVNIKELNRLGDKGLPEDTFYPFSSYEKRYNLEKMSKCLIKAKLILGGKLSFYVIYWLLLDLSTIKKTNQISVSSANHEILNTIYEGKSLRSHLEELVRIGNKESYSHNYGTLFCKICKFVIDKAITR